MSFDVRTKHVILFDLDGTLTDPFQGFAASMSFAMAHLGLPEINRDALRRMIGPPLGESFASLGLCPEKIAEGIRAYRRHYAQVGIAGNTVYPGVPQLLQRLRAQGKTLAVATSKPQPFAAQILSRFGLETYFAFIAGSNLDNTRTKKSEVIAYALENLGNPPPKSVLMVGDRLHDIEGAKSLGIDAVGLLRGYGGEEELMGCGARGVFQTAGRLADFLCT